MICRTLWEMQLLEVTSPFFLHSTLARVASFEDVFILWHCIIIVEAFLGVNLDLSALYHGFDVV
jgi:hypothetical protein